MTGTPSDAWTVYIEKLPEFSDASRGRGGELAELLAIPALGALRRLIRYDLQGTDATVLRTAVDHLLADPVTDHASLDPPDHRGFHAIAVELLPGQFDQRADSAAEAIEILSGGVRPEVRVSEIYLVPEGLSDEEIRRFTEQVVNTVDSRTCEPFGPPRFHREVSDPAPVPVITDFFKIASTPDGVDTLGLAMSPEDLAVCRRYFQEEEQRAPTETEIRVLDTYWSDHCRHTTFETTLGEIEIDGEGPATEAIRRSHRRFLELRRELYDGVRAAAPPTLMEAATIAAKRARRNGGLEDLLVSDEVNAATVAIDVRTPEGTEKWYLLFKNETHNHPTEIEPIGGAETCLGGAIRDPLSGRAYVHQAMRITGSADPRTPIEATRPGKLPQRTITTQAARGFSSYGNQIGLATGVVQEFYHPGYEAKRLEIGAVIGAAPTAQVVHRQPAPGDVVVLIGGRTGRDGCGGATGSSKAHDLSSITEASAEVQKGNPPVERALQRLFRNGDFSGRVKRANDFGAGGVSVAVGEIADGVSIDLDAIPVKYDGLTGTELAISESQERMAIVVDPTDLEFVGRAAAEENLEATAIARVTGERRLVMYHGGRRIVDIARSFLDTNGAARSTRVRVTPPRPRGTGDAGGPSSGRGSSTVPAGHTPPGDADITDPGRWLARIAEPDAASRKGLSENFDSTIGAGTLLAPWGGRYQLTPVPVGAARIPHPTAPVSTASFISYGFFPETSSASPYHGAYWSVVEAVTRLVCAGARRSRIRLSLQEYFPRTGSDPARWGLPYAALLGALEAQLALEAPAIGGKDSMSGTFEDLDVPPTLVAFSFAADDEARIVGPELSPEGGPLVLLAPPVGPDGVIDPRYLTATLDLVEELISAGSILAAGSVSEGGVALAVTTAAMGNWCTLDLDESALRRADELVGVLTGRQVAVYLQLAAPPTAGMQGLPGFVELGTVRSTVEDPVYPADRRGPIGPTRSGMISIGDRTLSLEAARDAWFSYLAPLFPLDGYDAPAEEEPPGPGESAGAPAGASTVGSASHPTPPRRRAPSTVHPRVCIPVFPGTNCEYDSERAFRDAGAEVVTPVFRKHSSEELDESIRTLASAIGKSQILMFPGGFSAGDEPDGSGKYIAAVFRDPRLVAAIASLINDRDGLILGICNGFQALVRMGLLPDGVAGLTAPPRTALFFNAGLHHISTIVPTRVTSTLSPWLAGTDPGQTYRVPVSHGEGRFVAPPDVLADLAAGGQIATQYVEYNPNGSRNAIEGISSPDGRILGKMAHNERVRPGLYRNVPPLEDMKLFENGVAYFR